ATGQDAGAVREAGNLDNGTPDAGTPSAAGTLSSTDIDTGATAARSVDHPAGTYGTFAINASSGAWTYNIDNSAGSAADKLAEGETHTETFTATVTDDKGATATETVTITVTGTNDSPVITTATGQDARAVREAGNLDNGTADAGTPSASGTLSSTDIDTGATAAWSVDHTRGTYSTLSLNESRGARSCNIDNPAGSNADKLAEGETHTETFIATVTDDKGATATETVTIT